MDQNEKFSDTLHMHLNEAGELHLDSTYTALLLAWIRASEKQIERINDLAKELQALGLFNGKL